jgi:hypothetical protein
MLSAKEMVKVGGADPRDTGTIHTQDKPPGGTTSLVIAPLPCRLGALVPFASDSLIGPGPGLVTRAAGWRVSRSRIVPSLARHAPGFAFSHKLIE